MAAVGLWFTARCASADPLGHLRELATHSHFRNVALVVGGLVFLLLFVVAWSVMLRHSVREKTYRLSREMEIRRRAESNLLRTADDLRASNLELERLEREKQSILNSMSELVLYFDVELRLVWMNQAARAVLEDVSEDTFSGSQEGCTCREVAFLRCFSCEDCPLIQALEERHTVQYEHTLPDGRVFSNTSNPVRNARGDVVGVVNVSLDISSQRLMQEEVLESRSRLILLNTFSMTLAQAGDVTSILSDLLDLLEAHFPDCGILLGCLGEEGRFRVDHCSGPACTGLDAGSVLDFSGAGSFLGALQYERSVAVEPGSEASLLDFSMTEGLEDIRALLAATVWQPDGETIVLMFLSTESRQWSRYAIQTQEAVADYLCFGLEQASLKRERLRAEERLAVSEEKLQEAMAIAKMGRWEMDVTSGEVSWSPQVYQIFDRAPTLGPPSVAEILDCFDPDDAREMQDLLDAARTQAQEAESDIRLYLPDGGTRWVHVSLRSVYNDAGEAERLEGTVQDISERKYYETQIESHLRELKRANKELEEFNYVASHDLQEPLRTLSSFCRLLEKDVGENLSERAREDIGFIRDAAERMQRLVQDLLDLSRAGRLALERGPVDLNTIVEECQKDLRALLDSTQGVIEWSSLPSIYADRRYVARLFQNLLGNGLKFHGADPPRVHIHADQVSGGVWKISVSDNGIGISPEHHARIFRPFQRLHGAGAYTGSGIGLALCRKIVERHGGVLEVDSTPGVGSVFSFTFPAVTQRWRSFREVEKGGNLYG